MIGIEIKNASEIIRQRKGLFLSKAFDLVGASDALVEKIIADKIAEILREQGVEAEVKLMSGAAID